MRANWITLVKTAATGTTFQQITPVSSLSCWSEKKSVVRSEFYAADAKTGGRSTRCLRCRRSTLTDTKG